jgi:putative cell wall-binding protein
MVPGNGSSVDGATLALLDSLGVQTVKLAGGTGVVSAAIESQLKSIFGNANVDRNSGANRYLTAVAINADEFTIAPVVYLATGEDFADALAGAALAGRDGAPLYAVPGTCVPQGVIDALVDLATTSVVLLGGPGVLGTNVANLTPCG